MKEYFSKLAATSALAAMLASGSVLASSQDGAEVADGLQRMFCDRQYTIIGDTDHDNVDIIRFLSRPDVVEAMKECGVRHIFVEKARELQDDFDSLINGAINKEIFVKRVMQAGYGNRGEARVGAYADFATTVTEEIDGVRFFAAQMPTAVAEITALKMHHEMGTRAYMDILPDDMKPDWEAAFLRGESIDDNRLAEMLEIIKQNQDHPSYYAAERSWAMADEIQRRMNEQDIDRADDKLLYDFVTATVPPADHAIIVIGNAHPQAREIGIYDRIGSERASWVAITDDIKSIDGRIPEAWVELGTNTVRFMQPHLP